MYAHNNSRLDTPPPPSQLRRPWSPEGDQAHYHRNLGMRDPSDASFEALDLADYAMTLQRTNNSMMCEPGPYPQMLDEHGYPLYPNTPPPRSQSLTSRGTYGTVPTLTSAPTSQGGPRPQSNGPYTPLQRPFSLPSSMPRNAPSPMLNNGNRMPRIFEPQSHHHAAELDIATFPTWSKDWYPTAKRDEYNVPGYYPNDVDTEESFPRPFSSSSGSHRNLLPWAAEDENQTNVSSVIKEERMRMLEKEFNSNGPERAEFSSDERKVVGNVDLKGNIITAGPKKRIMFRWVQGLFALGASVASLYSAIVRNVCLNQFTYLIFVLTYSFSNLVVHPHPVANSLPICSTSFQFLRCFLYFSCSSFAHAVAQGVASGHPMENWVLEG